MLETLIILLLFQICIVGAFVGGMYIGLKNKKEDPRKDTEETLDEKVIRKREEQLQQDEAFKTLMSYNIETAYGMDSSREVN